MSSSAADSLALTPAEQAAHAGAHAEQQAEREAIEERKAKRSFETCEKGWRAVKRLRTSDPTADGNVYDALFDWLRDKGAVGLDQLRVAQSAGGVGLFARSAIACGGAIAEIPQQCVLSAAAAWRSDAGQACRRAVAADPSLSEVIDDGFVLALSLAAARRCAEHPFHCYAQSLPDEAPSAPYWEPAYKGRGMPRKAVPSRAQERLQGTTLDAMIRTARARIETACDAVQAYCDDGEGASSGLTGSDGVAIADADGTWRERVRWAYSMYMSRGFTATLYHADHAPASASAPAPASASGEHGVSSAQAPAAESANVASEAGGVMLPLFDLMNHASTTAIEWSHDTQRVRFRTLAPAGVSAGGEIFNNYGPKSNEELLLHHGFALRDNEYDVYTLVLAVVAAPPAAAGSGSGADAARGTAPGTVSRLGPFYIRRANPRWQQFPDALWRALAGELPGQEQGGQQGDADGGGADGDGAVAVGQEEVELLLGTLRQRLLPFAATADDAKGAFETAVLGDKERGASEGLPGESMACDRQDVFAARYRNGQRVVLQEAIETLEEMLGLGIDDDDDGTTT